MNESISLSFQDLTIATIINSIPEAILIFNSELEIVQTNLLSESLFGYEKTELIGDGLEKLFPVHFRQQQSNKLKSDLKNIISDDQIWCGSRKNSTEFLFEMKVNKLLTIEGEMVIASLREKSEEDKVLPSNNELESGEQYRPDSEEDESLFQTVAENSTAMLFIHQKTNVVYANQACNTITGYTVEEMKEMDPFMIAHPDEREIIRKRSETRRRGMRMPNQYEMKILTKNGATRWVITSVNLIKYKGDNALMVTCYDITDRKKAEQLMVESERRYRILINNIADAILLLDENGNILEVNAEACRSLGYAKTELCEMNITDIEMQFKELSFETEMGELELGGKWKKDGIHRRKDGSTFPVDVNVIKFQSDYKPLLLAAIRDVTEQKRVEEEIRKLNETLEGRVIDRTHQLEEMNESLYLSEQRLRQIIDQIPNWIFAKDKDGVYILVNKSLAEAYSSTVEEVVGKKEDIFTADEKEAERFREADLKVFQSGKPLYVEESVTLPNGEKRYVQTNKIPFTFSGTDTPAVLGTSNDVTQIIEAEMEIRRLNTELEERVKMRTAELELVNKELESFSYSVSHDLRAPLRAVDGFSRALLEDYSDKLDEQGQHYLNRVRFTTKRMGKLIDDLLKLSRLTRSEIFRSKVNLSVMAHHIAGELQKESSQRDTEFIVEDGVVVNADPNLIEVVLRNFLQNSWKFTSKHPKGRIEFGMTQQGAEKVYFVRDDGAGFEQAYAGKLFGAFQRLHTLSEFEGTGVGLATVQRIIHRHGGRVWAEGEVEKGAVFYFTI